MPLPPKKAAQACRACHRLKRKCTRDMPSCSLCVRLNKSCDYPISPGLESSPGSNVIERLRHLEQLLEVDQAEESNTSRNTGNDIASFTSTSDNVQQFPSSYFLDSDFFSPIHPDALSPGRQPFMQQALVLLGPDQNAICDAYFSSIHTWLPMISRKLLLYEIKYPKPETEARNTLLLLCMKLCAKTSNTSANTAERHDEAPLYIFVRSVCSAVEMGGSISLRLVQSLVLLAVYEFGHGIYPSAYLTLGRAARLGSIMGTHNRRHARQLFTDADTWTLREEQRRTWWSVFVLDRIENTETVGLPFVAPEPSSDDLLPINDVEWEDGRVGSNEPLLTTSFHSVQRLGSFARLCQATHMLGKVIDHRTHKKQNTQDIGQLLFEAMQLHRALVAMEASLKPPVPEQPPSSASSHSIEISNLPALAVSSSARFLLYGQYGCNEPDESAVRERLALETEMQHISQAGIKELAGSTVPWIVYSLDEMAVSSGDNRAKARFPLLLFPCLYYAATECAWFIREDHEPRMYRALRDILQGMQVLRESWGVGDEYMALLERGEVLKLLNEAQSTATSYSGASN